MKKWFKKVLSMLCIIALLATSMVLVFAEETAEEATVQETVSEIEEAPVAPAPEAEQAPATEETTEE